MDPIIYYIAGVITGAVLVIIINMINKRNLEKTFGHLSKEALSHNTDEFLKLANDKLTGQTQMGEKNLEGKKKLIDQSLEVMNNSLKEVHKVVADYKTDREQKFGALANQLEVTNKQTHRLQETTSHLSSVLSDKKARGQWGERMAEDVLKLAGFIEGINYQKQKTQETGQRPDFTFFFLPQEKIINMDVKFPFNNYLKYSETESEADRSQYKKQFLRDVKDRIKEVVTRDYVNPNTVDYVLLFIPNEQVYSFIHQHDRDLLDNALKSKVIFCSPLTLYAILVVIRQAMDNFHLENTASEILNCLTAFEKQWGEFMTSFDKLGKKLEDAQSEFHNLTTTRKNKLDVQLRQVEDLRKQRGIE